MITAVLGVAWAGAAYLPIDPDYPAERTGFMLADAGPAAVIGTAQAAAALPAGPGGPARVILDDPGVQAAVARCPLAPPVPVRPQGAAYVMYTSGSTGTPKGTVVTHGGLMNYVTWCLGAYPELAGTSLLHAPSSFDAGVTVLYGVLASGGCVVAAGLDTGLPAMLGGRRLTFLKITPSHLAVLADLPPSCAPAGRLMIGAEPLTSARAAAWQAAHPAVTIVNHYGATELTVGCAHYQIRPGQQIPGPLVPAGRPFANVQAYILDAALQPVPDGVTGELYIAGAGLARGYARRAALTAERFPACPFGPPGTRMYRTGDLARWDQQGQLLVTGRADDQIKIRGFRVEPAEITATLTSYPAIAQAAVITREDTPGHQHLIAYIVPEDPATPIDTTAIRGYTAARLPDHMIPAAIITLNALPTTANGKLDHTALPAPDFTGLAGNREPATPAEELLCNLFAEILRLERVGADDGFFDLGGNSLLAMRLVARARAMFDAEIGIQVLFSAPTPAGIARALDTRGAADDEFGILLPIRWHGDQQPLFCIHPVAGISWCYAGLARQVPDEYPIYGLQARALTEPDKMPQSIEEMAADYLERIRQIQPAGPYQLLGWSLGGLVAHAMATQLQSRGEQASLLVLLDSYPAGRVQRRGRPPRAAIIKAIAEATGFDASIEPGSPLPNRAAGSSGHEEGPVGYLSTDRLSAIADVAVSGHKLTRNFTPGLFDGDLHFFRAALPRAPARPGPEAWAPYVSGKTKTYNIDSKHGDMARAEHLSEIGQIISALLSGKGIPE
jgi:nonribosomal peptide synthetase DhbF